MSAAEKKFVYGIFNDDEVVVNAIGTLSTWKYQVGRLKVVLVSS